MFPLALLPQVKVQPELAQTGVYLLLGPRPDGEGDMLYLGEGDPIRPPAGVPPCAKGLLDPRHWLHHHSRAAQQGACAVSGVAHLALDRSAKRMPLDNANQPAEPSLSEADRADMEVFLAHMLCMLPVLGVHAFEQPTYPHRA